MRRFARLICLSVFAFLLVSFLVTRHTSQKAWSSMTDSSWAANTHIVPAEEQGRGPPPYNNYGTDGDGDDSSDSIYDGDDSDTPHGGYDAPSTHRLTEDKDEVPYGIDRPAAQRYPNRPALSSDSQDDEPLTAPHSPDRDADLHDDLLRPFPVRPDRENSFQNEEEKNIAEGLGLVRPAHPLPQTAVTQTATYPIAPTQAGAVQTNTAAPAPAPAPYHSQAYPDEANTVKPALDDGYDGPRSHGYLYGPEPDNIYDSHERPMGQNHYSELERPDSQNRYAVRPEDTHPDTLPEMGSDRYAYHERPAAPRPQRPEVTQAASASAAMASIVSDVINNYSASATLTRANAAVPTNAAAAAAAAAAPAAGAVADDGNALTDEGRQFVEFVHNLQALQEQTQQDPNVQVNPNAPLDEATRADLLN